MITLDSIDISGKKNLQSNFSFHQEYNQLKSSKYNAFFCIFSVISCEFQIFDSRPFLKYIFSKFLIVFKNVLCFKVCKRTRHHYNFPATFISLSPALITPPTYNKFQNKLAGYFQHYACFQHYA